MTETRNNSTFLLLPFFCLTAVICLHGLAHAQEDESAAGDAALADEAVTDYRAALRYTRDALMAAGDFEAALDPAQIIISELETFEADASPDRVMLAVILAELESFDDAEIELLGVVEKMQADEGLYTQSLIDPLRILGRTYMRAGRFPEAVTSLVQAREISRRAAGLFNVEHQIEVIDDLTTAYLGLRDTTAARDLQIERLEVAQRQFGADDPAAIPFYNTYADYLERSRLRRSARAQYETVLAIAESANDTAQMLTALSNIVRQDLQTNTHRAAREQLTELISSPTAQDHIQELGIAHAVLGDAALTEEEGRDANEHYRRAWELLEAAEETDPATYFADPVAIRLIPPLTIVDVTERDLPYEFGSIELVFDVNEDGRVEEITGLGSQPPEIMDDAYVERLLAAWFRPPLVDGERVAATDIVFTHYFRFYVEFED